MQSEGPTNQVDVDESDFIRSRGLSFPDDSRYLSDRHKNMLRRNAYEEMESIAALKAINASDRVLELGAGIGYMSSLISKHCAPQAILSFEANPRLIPYIRAVHRVNQVTGASVENALLSADEGGTKPFYIRGDFLASSLSDDLGDAHGGVVEVADVPVIPLAQVLAEFQPTVLVCDIEGAEVDLLGCADLSCLRAVIIELHPQWVGQSGIQTIFDTMARAGMTYFPRSSHGKVVLFKKDW